MKVTLSDWEGPWCTDAYRLGDCGTVKEVGTLGCSLKCVTGTCTVRRPGARRVPMVQSVPMGGLTGGTEGGVQGVQSLAIDDQRTGFGRLTFARLSPMEDLSALVGLGCVW